MKRTNQIKKIAILLTIFFVCKIILFDSNANNPTMHTSQHYSMMHDESNRDINEY